VSEAPLVGAARDHAALMNRIYRGQRHIYDLTRKYYLFGRDRTIAGLDCKPGDAVLEIACGTGRNLRAAARRWPGVQLYGIDISSEMLRSAEAALGGNARLAVGDACALDTARLLGRERFDRVILSYCLSMIPGWPAALDQAAQLLTPGGSVHIVDFGDLGGLPGPLAAAMRSWLATFHVAPRSDLRLAASRVAARHALYADQRTGPLGYYQQVTLTAPR
jgi:S-adenosylmethionine-diacylgycerolhomoserine-N-methlytransferase